MTRPLAVDLCCGLGGWTEGLLAENWDVVGFDIERHQYGAHQYPAQLVLQDILTLDGRQFKGKVSLIVASPPCQKYSYMSMPWTRAKDLAKWYRDPSHPERLVELTALFDACHRIAAEAECPIVVENVRGAQPWVGRARWMYGSFALWGDVPALMPVTHRGVKVPGMDWNGSDKPGYKAVAFNDHRHISAAWRSKSFATAEAMGIKQSGISGPRTNGKGDRWFQDGAARSGSKSMARKMASAKIAKIPFPLASWIAQCYLPKREAA